MTDHNWEGGLYIETCPVAISIKDLVPSKAVYPIILNLVCC